MTDEADRTEDDTEFLLDAKVKDIHSKVINIPVGTQGECDNCGEEAPRLVDGNCCKCRDKFKLY